MKLSGVFGQKGYLTINSINGHTIVAACFADQCPSPPIPKPTPRDPKLTCKLACQQDDPLCVKYALNPGDPIELEVAQGLRDFTSTIMTATPPVAVSVAGFVDASNSYTGSSSCFRTDLTIEAASTGRIFPFNNSGASCPVGFQVNGVSVELLEVSLPGELSGLIEIGSHDFRLEPEDEAHSPSMFVTESGGGRVFEPIIFVEGQERELTFTGENYYCAQITWSGD